MKNIKKVIAITLAPLMLVSCGTKEETDNTEKSHGEWYSSTKVIKIDGYKIIINRSGGMIPHPGCEKVKQDRKDELSFR